MPFILSKIDILLPLEFIFNSSYAVSFTPKVTYTYNNFPYQLDIKRNPIYRNEHRNVDTIS